MSKLSSFLKNDGFVSQRLVSLIIEIEESNKEMREAIEDTERLLTKLVEEIDSLPEADKKYKAMVTQQIVENRSACDMYSSNNLDRRGNKP